MRNLGLSLAAAALAATLCGCGKSSTSQQAENTQTSASQPPATPSEPAPAKLSEAERQKLLTSLPAPYNTGDLANGEAKFALCRSCHTITPGGPNMTGPNLYGVFGRKAGSKPDFHYSDALKNANFTWDAAHLDMWLSDPKTYLPGTKMIFAGVKAEKDRIDLISFLKVETGYKPS
jgi:cytochrome c